MNTLAIVPHYRHADTLPEVTVALRRHGLTVLVVDDGSGEDCRAVLETLRADGIEILWRGQNGGKGAAMKDGFRWARQHGFSHVLQIDADAQHRFDDIGTLLAASAAVPDALVCGRPVYGADAPKARLYGRKITDFWNMLHTGSLQIKDGMCGFRIYPLAPSCEVIERETVGDRMDFDNEILIRLYWRGVPLRWIDTPVSYRSGGVSHFHVWRDNCLISKMHARLFFARLAHLAGLR